MVKFIDIHGHCVQEHYVPYPPGKSGAVRHQISDPSEMLEFYDYHGVEKGVILPLCNAENTMQSQSNEEVLNIAEEESKAAEAHFRDLVFGLLDVSTAVFFFLPLFGEKGSGGISGVSLPVLDGIAAYMKTAYFVTVLGMIIWGVVTLALQNWYAPRFLRCKNGVSLLWNGAGTLLFIVSRQPYAAALMFVFLMIKGLILMKKG